MWSEWYLLGQGLGVQVARGTGYHQVPEAMNRQAYWNSNWALSKMMLSIVRTEWSRRADSHVNGVPQVRGVEILTRSVFLSNCSPLDSTTLNLLVGPSRLELSPQGCSIEGLDLEVVRLLEGSQGFRHVVHFHSRRARLSSARKKFLEVSPHQDYSGGTI